MTDSIVARHGALKRLVRTGVQWSFVRAVGGVSIVRASGGALLFLSQVLIAAWMGADDFGICRFAWACVAILATLAGLGVPGTSVRFIARYDAGGDPKRLRGLLRFCRTNKLAAACVTSLGAIASVTVFPGDTRYSDALRLSFLAIPASPSSTWTPPKHAASTG